MLQNRSLSQDRKILLRRTKNVLYSIGFDFDSKVDQIFSSDKVRALSRSRFLLNTFLQHE